MFKRFKNWLLSFFGYKSKPVYTFTSVYTPTDDEINKLEEQDEVYDEFRNEVEPNEIERERLIGEAKEFIEIWQLRLKELEKASK